MKNNPGNEFSNRKSFDTTPAASAACERADDLLAYLYGEMSSDAEARNFLAHMHQCAACRDEYGFFSAVRESIGAWRAESFSFLDAAALQAESVFDVEQSAIKDKRARSPFAALREFVSLSPAWMRAGVAFATLFVCAAAMLGVANAEFSWNAGGVSFRTHVAPVRVVEKKIPLEPLIKAGYSDEELNAQVEERVQSRLAELQRDMKQPSAYLATTAYASRTPRKRAANTQTDFARLNQTTISHGLYTASSPQNRVEIADERDLPRLSDLLKEGSER